MLAYFRYQKIFRSPWFGGRWSGWHNARSVVAVNVNRDGDEWNVNANELDYNDRWNEGNSFFAPETAYYFYLSLFVERFLFAKLRFYAVFPPAQDFSDFLQFSG